MSKLVTKAFADFHPALTVELHNLFQKERLNECIRFVVFDKGGTNHI